MNGSGSYGNSMAIYFRTHVANVRTCLGAKGFPAYRLWGNICTAIIAIEDI